MEGMPPLGPAHQGKEMAGLRRVCKSDCVTGAVALD